MRKAIGRILLSVALTAVCCRSAAAWSHAGRWGAESGGGGSWSARGYRGGSASGGGGSWSGTGYRGGTASGGGGSWSAKSPYGGSAYHTPGETTVHQGNTYYGGYYPAYHPPTTVNYYGSGCYGCGGWSTAGAAAAGVVVGAAEGASVAAASQGAAASNAYSAGYAAGSAVKPQYAIGTIVTTLPDGCGNATVGSATYFLCGNTWFKPSYGANGVYYRVIEAP